MIKGKTMIKYTKPTKSFSVELQSTKPIKYYLVKTTKSIKPI